MNIYYQPGKLHPSLTIPFDSVRSCNRLPIKLKLLTGTYILQVNRVAFNQNEVDPTCRLCQTNKETLEHFILTCPMLESIRAVCFPEIAQEVKRMFCLDFHVLPMRSRVSLIIDCTTFISCELKKKQKQFNELLKNLQKLEEQCRRFLYLVNCARFRLLSVTNVSKGRKARGRHN